MAKIEKVIYNLKKFDALSYQDTFIHRLDPRVKVITTLIYIVLVVSYNKFQVIPLFPLLFYPLFLMYAGNIPFFYIFKKVLLISPFVLFIGVVNLFMEKTVLFYFFSLGITTGWLSFISILLRFFLTVFATFSLIACTGFNTLCFALTSGIKLPAVFVNQLLFLYRYVFILIEESVLVIRAHQVRAFKNTIPMKTFGYIVGHLLLRTLNRAERIHTAMLARGFDGKIRINKKLKIRKVDVFFMLGWICFFIAARVWNLPMLLGKLFTGWSV